MVTETSQPIHPTSNSHVRHHLGVGAAAAAAVNPYGQKRIDSSMGGGVSSSSQVGAMAASSELIDLIDLTSFENDQDRGGRGTDASRRIQQQQASQQPLASSRYHHVPFNTSSFELQQSSSHRGFIHSNLSAGGEMGLLNSSASDYGNYLNPLATRRQNNGLRNISPAVSGSINNNSNKIKDDNGPDLGDLGLPHNLSLTQAAKDASDAYNYQSESDGQQRRNAHPLYPQRAGLIGHSASQEQHFHLPHNLSLSKVAKGGHEEYRDDDDSYNSYYRDAEAEDHTSSGGYQMVDYARDDDFILHSESQDNVIIPPVPSDEVANYSSGEDRRKSVDDGKDGAGGGGYFGDSDSVAGKSDVATTGEVSGFAVRLAERRAARARLEALTHEFPSSLTLQIRDDINLVNALTGRNYSQLSAASKVTKQGERSRLDKVLADCASDVASEAPITITRSIESEYNSKMSRCMAGANTVSSGKHQAIAITPSLETELMMQALGLPTKEETYSVCSTDAASPNRTHARSHSQPITITPSFETEYEYNRGQKSAKNSRQSERHDPIAITPSFETEYMNMNVNDKQPEDYPTRKTSDTKRCDPIAITESFETEYNMMKTVERRSISASDSSVDATRQAQRRPSEPISITPSFETEYNAKTAVRPNASDTSSAAAGKTAIDASEAGPITLSASFEKDFIASKKSDTGSVSTADARAPLVVKGKDVGSSEGTTQVNETSARAAPGPQSSLSLSESSSDEVVDRSHQKLLLAQASSSKSLQNNVPKSGPNSSATGLDVIQSNTPANLKASIPSSAGPQLLEKDADAEKSHATKRIKESKETHHPITITPSLETDYMENGSKKQAGRKSSSGDDSESESKTIAITPSIETEIENMSTSREHRRAHLPPSSSSSSMNIRTGMETEYRNDQTKKSQASDSDPRAIAITDSIETAVLNNEEQKIEPASTTNSERRARESHRFGSSPGKMSSILQTALLRSANATVRPGHVVVEDEEHSSTSNMERSFPTAETRISDTASRPLKTEDTLKKADIIAVESITSLEQKGGDTIGDEDRTFEDAAPYSSMYRRAIMARRMKKKIADGGRQDTDSASRYTHDTPETQEDNEESDPKEPSQFRKALKNKYRKLVESLQPHEQDGKTLARSDSEAQIANLRKLLHTHESKDIAAAIDAKNRISEPGTHQGEAQSDFEINIAENDNEVELVASESALSRECIDENEYRNEVGAGMNTKENSKEERDNLKDKTPREQKRFFVGKTAKPTVDMDSLIDSENSDVEHSASEDSESEHPKHSCGRGGGNANKASKIEREIMSKIIDAEDEANAQPGPYSKDLAISDNDSTTTCSSSAQQKKKKKVEFAEKTEVFEGGILISSSGSTEAILTAKVPVPADSRVSTDKEAKVLESATRKTEEIVQVVDKQEIGDKAMQQSKIAVDTVYESSDDVTTEDENWRSNHQYHEERRDYSTDDQANKGYSTDDQGNGGYTTDENAASTSDDNGAETEISIINSSSDSDMLDPELDPHVLYDSDAINFVAQILDKSCAWLEDDSCACNYQSPSLLREVKKKTQVDTDAAHEKLSATIVASRLRGKAPTFVRNAAKQAHTSALVQRLHNAQNMKKSNDLAAEKADSSSVSSLPVSVYARPRTKRSKSPRKLKEEKKSIDRSSSPRKSQRDTDPDRERTPRSSGGRRPPRHSDSSRKKNSSIQALPLSPRISSGKDDENIPQSPALVPRKKISKVEDGDRPSRSSSPRKKSSPRNDEHSSKKKSPSPSPRRKSASKSEERAKKFQKKDQMSSVALRSSSRIEESVSQMTPRTRETLIAQQSPGLPSPGEQTPVPRSASPLKHLMTKTVDNASESSQLSSPHLSAPQLSQKKAPQPPSPQRPATQLTTSKLTPQLPATPSATSPYGTHNMTLQAQHPQQLRQPSPQPMLQLQPQHFSLGNSKSTPSPQAFFPPSPTDSQTIPRELLQTTGASLSSSVEPESAAIPRDAPSSSSAVPNAALSVAASNLQRSTRKTEVATLPPLALSPLNQTHILSPPRPEELPISPFQKKLQERLASVRGPTTLSGLVSKDSTYGNVFFGEKESRDDYDQGNDYDHFDDDHYFIQGGESSGLPGADNGIDNQYKGFRSQSNDSGDDPSTYSRRSVKSHLSGGSGSGAGGPEVVGARERLMNSKLDRFLKSPRTIRPHSATSRLVEQLETIEEANSGDGGWALESPASYHATAATTNSREHWTSENRFMESQYAPSCREKQQYDGEAEDVQHSGVMWGDMEPSHSRYTSAARDSRRLAHHENNFGFQEDISYHYSHDDFADPEENNHKKSNNDRQHNSVGNSSSSSMHSSVLQGLTEAERMAALELAEKLRRRAATLKRRRRARARREQEMASSGYSSGESKDRYYYEEEEGEPSHDISALTRRIKSF